MKIGEYEQMMSYLTRPAAETRESFAKGTNKFLVKVGKPVKDGNVIEQKFEEVIGSRNRPETYKKTGVNKTLYKPQIIVNNKTILTTDFGSKEDATTAVKNYRKKNPIKNAPPDLETLDERKKKRYINRKARQEDIVARGGIPEGGPFAGTKEMHKGHAGNIRGSQKITGDKLIYTPSTINQAMAGSEGESRFTDLDYKIDATEKEIDKIKNSKMSAAKKKTELAKLDNKLVEYAGQSDGYKVVTLSDGTDYGGSFRKLQSIDPMDIFPDMTEVEIKDFIKNADPNNFEDQLKIKLFKENAPKLKASLIPGLEKIGNEIAQGIKNIPDDIKKKKFFKLGLKALGPLGTYIAVDDTYEAFKKGKSFAESIEYGLIGTNIVGSTKDLLALSPEEREARSVVKQAEMADQIAQDESMLDSDFETPKVKSDLTDEEAKRKYQLAQERIEAENKENEAKIARARAISMSGLKDLITGKRFAGQEMPTQYMAAGGRMGFADGPDDPSRRKFMKIAGGIASIPIVGKFLKPAMVAAPKVVEVVKRGVDGTPEFLGDLITKIVTFGKKNFTGNRADEFADQYRLDDYVVTQQGNKTTIQKFDDPDNPNYKEIEIELETDPETGGVTYNEASVRPDAEGKLKDVEEYIDDLDLEDMKKYTYDE